MDKPLKIVVMDGAFDGLEQDEIDGIMEEMQQLIDSGELMENSTPVDMDKLAIEDPAMFKLLSEAMDTLPGRTLH